MDNYLIDREALSQAVDQMMAKRTFPNQTPEEINALREEKISALDERIGMAIFSQLNESQLDQLNAILDNEDSSPEVFGDFFSAAGVDVKGTVATAVENFQTEFLGGQNV